MNRIAISVWAVTIAGPILLACSDNPTPVQPERFSVSSDSTFAVGDSSVLQVANFAGSVVVSEGDVGEVSIHITKWANEAAHLDEIEADLIAIQNGVRVRTENPSMLLGVSVDVEVLVPPDCRPNIEQAAGDVRYTGPAQGDSYFGTAAGNIRIELPATVNVEVHLSVAAGSIEVDFPVSGTVGKREIDGVIGTGMDGNIEARVAAGTITVVPQ